MVTSFYFTKFGLRWKAMNLLFEFKEMGLI